MECDTSGPSSIHISDVIEVIQTTDPEFAEEKYNHGYAVSSMEEEKQTAYVEIVEQPAPKALRFRYECEGRSAGSIPGASSSPEKKTYPTIRVVGYTGRAVVVVSCVTKDPPYRPHPHSLVGKEGCKRGVCTLEMSDDMTATFSNLGIQCVKKRDIDEALRCREEIRVDPFRTGFAHRNQPSTIDLNAVRLCFQVFIEGTEKGKFTFQLTPVVSEPIYDKKAMSDLVICKMSDCSASVAGGKEIILLCEKVAKEDVQVRFFEQDSSGNILWEAQGDFTPANVHKQVAITLRTPRYREMDTIQIIQAFIQLRRPSDGALSEPLPFQIFPLDSGRSWLRRKAKGDYSTFSSILAQNTAILTGNTPVAVDSDNSKSLIANSSPFIGQVPGVAVDENKIDPASPATGAEGEGPSVAIVGAQTEPKVSTVDEPEPDFSEQVENTEIIEIIPITNIGKDNVARDPNEFCEKIAKEEQKKQAYDYAEVQKEKDATQKFTENLLEQLKNEENLRNTSITEACQSINELLSQVTDFNPVVSPTENVVNMDVELYDEEAYSSLQLAMKNPIQLFDDLTSGKYEDVMATPYKPQSPLISIVPLSDSINSNKRESLPTPTTPESKLPPLPPKRIRKSPPAPPARPEAPPNKTLPPPPATETSQKQSLKPPGLFSKLFSKRSSKSKKDSGSNRGSISEGPTREATPRGSICETLQCDMDITEAEHYALYTDMAPRATVSEFDEASFYYSPVEGGSILSQQQTLKRSQQDISA